MTDNSKTLTDWTDILEDKKKSVKVDLKKIKPVNLGTSDIASEVLDKPKGKPQIDENIKLLSTPNKIASEILDRPEAGIPDINEPTTTDWYDLIQSSALGKIHEYDTSKISSDLAEGMKATADLIKNFGKGFLRELLSTPEIGYRAAEMYGKLFAYSAPHTLPYHYAYINPKYYSELNKLQIGNPQLVETMKKKIKKHEQGLNLLGLTPDNDAIDAFMFGLGSGAYSLGEALLLGTALKDPDIASKLVGTKFGVQEMLRFFDKATKVDDSELQSLKNAGMATLSGVLEAALEGLELKVLLKKFGGNQFAEWMIKSATEGAEEFLQNIKTDILENLNEMQKKKIKDILTDAALAGSMGFILGGAAGKVAPVLMKNNAYIQQAKEKLIDVGLDENTAMGIIQQLGSDLAEKFVDVLEGKLKVPIRMYAVEEGKTPEEKQLKDEKALIKKAKKYKKPEDFAKSINLIDRDDNDIEDLNGDKPLPNTDGTLTLYHATSKNNANKIVKEGFKRIAEDEIFFSTKPSNKIKDFGDTIIIVKIKPNKLQIDDAFKDGEIHLSALPEDLQGVDIVDIVPYDKIKNKSIDTAFSFWQKIHQTVNISKQKTTKKTKSLIKQFGVYNVDMNAPALKKIIIDGDKTYTPIKKIDNDTYLAIMDKDGTVDRVNIKGKKIYYDKTQEGKTIKDLFNPPAKEKELMELIEQGYHKLTKQQYINKNIKEFNMDKTAEVKQELSQEYDELQRFARAKKLLKSIDTKILDLKNKIYEAKNKVNERVYKNAMKEFERYRNRLFTLVMKENIKTDKAFNKLKREYEKFAESVYKKANEDITKAEKKIKRYEELKRKQKMRDIAKKINKLAKQLPDDYPFKYDLSFRTKKKLQERIELKKIVEDLQERGIDTDTFFDEKVIEKLNAKTLNDMSLEELEELYDTVKSIIQANKLEEKVAKANQAKNIQEVVLKILRENFKKWNAEDRKLVESKLQRLNKKGKQYLIEHFTMETIGTLLGDTFYKNVVKPLYEADEKLLDYMERIKEIHDIIPTLIDRGNEKFEIKINNEYTTGRRQHAYFIYAHSFNENGLRHLLASGIDEDSIMDIAMKLTEEEKQEIRKLHKYYEEEYNRINKVYKNLTGNELPKETNYFPIQGLELTDSQKFLSTIIDALKVELGIKKAKPFEGMTKKRTKSKLPFKNFEFFQTIFRHHLNVARYIATAETVAKINMILYNKSFVNFMKSDETLKELYDNIIFNLKTFLSGLKPPESTTQKVITFLQRNFPVAAITYNLASTAKAPISFFTGLDEIYNEFPDKRTTRLIISNVLNMLTKSPKKLINEAREKSFVVRHRKLGQSQELTLIKDLMQKELLRPSNKYYKIFKDGWRLYQQLGFLPWHYADLITVTTLFHIAYNTALANGYKEEDALNFANRMLIRTQPMGGALYTPKAHKLNRLFSLFLNQPMRNFNTLVLDFALKRWGKHRVRKAAIKIFIPAFIMALINYAKDRKELWHKFVKETITYPVQGLVILGTLLKGYYNTSFLSALEDEMKRLYQSKSLEKKIKHALKLLGFTFGVPGTVGFGSTKRVITGKKKKKKKKIIGNVGTGADITTGGLSWSDI